MAKMSAEEQRDKLLGVLSAAVGVAGDQSVVAKFGDSVDRLMEGNVCAASSERHGEDDFVDPGRAPATALCNDDDASGEGVNVEDAGESLEYDSDEEEAFRDAEAADIGDFLVDDVDDGELSDDADSVGLFEGLDNESGSASGDEYESGSSELMADAAGDEEYGGSESSDDDDGDDELESGDEEEDAKEIAAEAAALRAPKNKKRKRGVELPSARERATMKKAQREAKRQRAAEAKDPETADRTALHVRRFAAYAVAREQAERAGSGRGGDYRCALEEAAKNGDAERANMLDSVLAIELVCNDAIARAKGGAPEVLRHAIDFVRNGYEVLDGSHASAIAAARCALLDEPVPADALATLVVQYRKADTGEWRRRELVCCAKLANMVRALHKIVNFEQVARRTALAWLASARKNKCDTVDAAVAEIVACSAKTAPPNKLRTQLKMALDTLDMSTALIDATHSELKK